MLLTAGRSSYLNECNQDNFQMMCPKAHILNNPNFFQIGNTKQHLESTCFHWLKFKLLKRMCQFLNLFQKREHFLTHYKRGQHEFKTKQKHSTKENKLQINNPHDMKACAKKSSTNTCTLISQCIKYACASQPTELYPSMHNFPNMEDPT